MTPQTIQTLEKDRAIAKPIIAKAQMAGLKALTEFTEANLEAHRSHDLDTIDRHLQRVVDETELFGVAYAMIEDIANLTDKLNKAMPRKLFGGTPDGATAKADVLRTVVYAYWLKTIIEEFNQTKETS